MRLAREQAARQKAMEDRKQAETRMSRLQEISLGLPRRLRSLKWQWRWLPRAHWPRARYQVRLGFATRMALFICWLVKGIPDAFMTSWQIIPADSQLPAALAIKQSKTIWIESKEQFLSEVPRSWSYCKSRQPPQFLCRDSLDC